MHRYLSASQYIDFDTPEVQAKARQLATQAASETELIRSSFEFVRDEIRHSSDFKLNPVTCKASDRLLLREKPPACRPAESQRRPDGAVLPTAIRYG